MATPPHPDFLSLDSDTLDGSTDPIHIPLQRHLDTLFAEFDRSRPRLSPPLRTPAASHPHLPAPSMRDVAAEPQVDLRALDYVSEYDSHLMCPICHVPFVDPVVLDCDHTFCRLCLDEYQEGANNSPRNTCPSCRTLLLARPHKASRLIVNMCNDIKVRCPNDDCEAVHPRGCIEQHAVKDCPEYQQNCPESTCEKKVKRKNFVPDQCIHSSHIECDCGAVIELGRGEWLKHKDEACPTTGVKCDLCEERISVKDYLAGRNAHICRSDTITLRCPGVPYGCSNTNPFSTPEELEFHTLTCPIALLTPHLKKQSDQLQSLTDQLTLTKVRNEVLETGLDKINDILTSRVLPNIPSHTPSRAPSPTPSSLSIEEIPRPPHQTNPYTLPAPQPTDFDILNLHTHLSDNITTLSTQLLTLQNNLADLDARTSMMLMNETLRIKEDLAQQGAGLFSTRAQVQWLLNRERERMVIAHQQQQTQTQSQAQAQHIGSERPGLARGRSSNVGGGVGAAAAAGEGSSSSARSSFSTGNAAGLEEGALLGTSPRLRPLGRRLSGSQERVKL